MVLEELVNVRLEMLANSVSSYSELSRHCTGLSFAIANMISEDEKMAEAFTTYCQTKFYENLMKSFDEGDFSYAACVAAMEKAILSTLDITRQPA